MSGDKIIFADLDESFRSFKFGNNERVSVLGKGKIRIILKNEKSNFISNVFYVPNLYHNLLSLWQLIEKWYDLRFKYGIGTITDDHLGLIAKIYMNISRLRPITLNCHDLPHFNSVVSDDIWLWHMYFDHLNFESLSFLTKRIWCMDCLLLIFLQNTASLVFWKRNTEILFLKARLGGLVVHWN